MRKSKHLYTVEELKALSLEERLALDPEEVPKGREAREQWLTDDLRAELFPPHPVTGLYDLRAACNYLGISRVLFWQHVWGKREPALPETTRLGRSTKLWSQAALDGLRPYLRKQGQPRKKEKPAPSGEYEGRRLGELSDAEFAGLVDRYNLSQIAREFHISRERVRQVLAQRLKRHNPTPDPT